jgi:hypothetical protein
VEAEERRSAELLSKALAMNVDKEARKGTKFTCFTGTQVQILTPALRCKDPPPDVLEIWDMVGDKLPGTPASFVSPYYPPGTVQAYVSMRQHTSACVSIRQHTFISPYYPPGTVPGYVLYWYKRTNTDAAHIHPRSPPACWRMLTYADEC